MSSIKLDAVELDQIEKYQEKFLTITQRYGEISYDIALLHRNLKTLEVELDRAETERAEFTKALTSKYGNGKVDLTTGTFIPDQLS